MHHSDASALRDARMLLVAHGTRSGAGLHTTRALRDVIAAARPAVDVDICYLDVVDPRLPDVLAADSRPAVVVPALLSTGYHVQSDIPTAIGDRPATLLARHLGPHPLLVDAMFDRIDGVPPGAAVHTALVGAGSSRPEARDELQQAAQLVAQRTGGEVPVFTMADDLPAVLSRLGKPLRVLTYLIAEGQFVTTLRAAADEQTVVGEPIGVHPALVELVWTRYDEALAANAVGPVG